MLAHPRGLRATSLPKGSGFDWSGLNITAIVGTKVHDGRHLMFARPAWSPLRGSRIQALIAVNVNVRDGCGLGRRLFLVFARPTPPFPNRTKEGLVGINVLDDGRSGGRLAFARTTLYPRHRNRIKKPRIAGCCLGRRHILARATRSSLRSRIRETVLVGINIHDGQTWIGDHRRLARPTRPSLVGRNNNIMVVFGRTRKTGCSRSLRRPACLCKNRNRNRLRIKIRKKFVVRIHIFDDEKMKGMGVGVEKGAF
jgi:hypothetical protein